MHKMNTMRKKETEVPSVGTFKKFIISSMDYSKNKLLLVMKNVKKLFEHQSHTVAKRNVVPNSYQAKMQ